MKENEHKENSCLSQGTTRNFSPKSLSGSPDCINSFISSWHTSNTAQTVAQAVLARHASLDFDPGFTLVSHLCDCTGTTSERPDTELCLHLSPERSAPTRLIASYSIDIDIKVDTLTSVENSFYFFHKRNINNPALEKDERSQSPLQITKQAWALTPFSMGSQNVWLQSVCINQLLFFLLPKWLHS